MEENKKLKKTINIKNEIIIGSNVCNYIKMKKKKTKTNL